MTAISIQCAVRQLVGALDEAFGVSETPGNYFTDKSPQAGLLGIVDSLNAAAASASVNGSSVAAQVFHVAYWCDGYARWIEGNDTEEDWSKSWAVSAVTDDEWNGLQQRLREGHCTLRQVIEAHAETKEDAFRAAIGAVAHVAYHLGAIRQKIAAMKQGNEQ